METKIFDGKKIKIRTLSKNDLNEAKEFQDFYNSLVEEEAQILANKKFSLKEEKRLLKEQLRKIKDHKMIFLVAKENDKVVGTLLISLGKGRQSHIGNLGIVIRKGYRGIGLGSYLMAKIINLAKKKLKPRPKIIRLRVFSTNKSAIRFNQKFGFKKVAKIPKQIEFKGKLVDEIIMLKRI